MQHGGEKVCRREGAAGKEVGARLSGRADRNLPPPCPLYHTTSPKRNHHLALGNIREQEKEES